jgi:CMP-N-acetylneuraminic acid synthetase
MPHKKLTALLPMKGHSERVPHKNIRTFVDKPLFRWVVDTLIASPPVAEVLINTDSDRIRELAEPLDKVRVLERPEELRGDFVSMNAIIGHDLGHICTEHVLQTHSTNPLLTIATVNRAIERYFASLGEHDSLFSVTPRHCRLYTEDGRPVNHNPEELLRTQDLPPLYEENSCLYIFSSRSFRENGERRIGGKPVLFPLSRLEAVDIDEEEDFLLAEALARTYRSGSLPEGRAFKPSRNGPRR